MKECPSQTSKPKEIISLRTTRQNYADKHTNA